MKSTRSESQAASGLHGATHQFWCVAAGTMERQPPTRSQPPDIFSAAIPRDESEALLHHIHGRVYDGVYVRNEHVGHNSASIL
eukprot:m.110588 g.110588  ORF g.110588 m.110588 type:complete len:83 (+) comp21314_c0_seq1:886-1134(+)